MKSFLIYIMILFNIFIFFACKENNPTIPITKYTLQGIVIDSENNNPVNGAIVTINGMEDSTGINGNFIFKNLSGGEYTLSINHPNYENYTNTIKVPTDSSLSISLSINYDDFLPLSIGELRYHYHYETSGFIVHYSSTTINGNHTWNIFEVFKRNDTTIYGVQDGGIDTVTEIFEGFQGTYIDTVSSYFEIREDNRHQINIQKFIDNDTFPRYLRSDTSEYVGFLLTGAYIELKRNTGMTLIEGGSGGTLNEYWHYNLIDSTN
jgi:CarboxypepD_reg-like domain